MVQAIQFTLPDRFADLRSAWGRFIADEDGATLVEYALIVALIAVAAVVAITLLGGAVRGRLEGAGNSIGGTSSP